jgi:hypothetical protein
MSISIPHMHLSIWFSDTYSAGFSIDFMSSDAKTPFRVSLSRRRTRLHCNEGASIETNAAWLLKPHLPCSFEGNEFSQRMRLPPVEREDQAPAKLFQTICRLGVPFPYKNRTPLPPPRSLFSFFGIASTHSLQPPRAQHHPSAGR